jgi:hypothetical protein
VDLEEGSVEKGRNVGKNMGTRSGRRRMGKWWATAAGAPKKGPKKFGKKIR